MSLLANIDEQLAGYVVICSIIFNIIKVMNAKYLKEPLCLSRYSDGILTVRPRFNSLEGQCSFLYSKAFRPTLWPTQPPTQSILGASFSGSKAAGT
jgi:hypothetical protein